LAGLDCHGNIAVVGADGSCECAHEHPGSEREGPTHTHQETPLAAYLLEGAFLFIAIILLILGNREGFHQIVGDLAISFVAIIAEAMPFMLLGSLVGGMIEVFVPQEWVQRSLGTRGYGAVFIAAGIGVLFPVCECAIVPVVRRLLHKGVPLSAAIAFLLGGPIVNPIVAGSTWLAYRGDWEVVITRMIGGYAIAVTVALMMHILYRNTDVLAEGAFAETAACGCCGHDHHAAAEPRTVARIWTAVQHACDDFFDVGKFLVIGAFVAALARTAIGVDELRQLFSSPVLAIVLMMGLAIALNLCSETDAFIAAGFQGVLPHSAQMAFMVLGPMLDMKLLLMYLTLFRKRVILTLSILTFATVLVAMIFLHYGAGGLSGGW
jgi:uncharacterized protein